MGADGGQRCWSLSGPSGLANTLTWKTSFLHLCDGRCARWSKALAFQRQLPILEQTVLRGEASPLRGPERFVTAGFLAWPLYVVAGPVGLSLGYGRTNSLCFWQPWACSGAWRGTVFILMAFDSQKSP